MRRGPYHRLRSGFAGCLLTVASLCAGAGAAAADAQTQAAEALYRQAKALMEQGELEEACEKFAASHALEPGLGTLLHLGDCYERAGRFASALETFETAAKLASERGDEAREHLASVRAKALGPRVPSLVIRRRGVAPAPDLQITINGTPLQSADLNRPLLRDAGGYDIRFSAPGHDAFVSHVELKNGAATGTVVDIPRLLRSSSAVASEPAPRPEEPADPNRGSTQRGVAWVVGGAGLALAVAAGVFTTLAMGKNDDSKGLCDPGDPNRCGPEGVELRNDAKSMATLATLTGVAGGLAVVGGVVLYVSAPTSESGVPDAALLTWQGRF